MVALTLAGVLVWNLCAVLRRHCLKARGMARSLRDEEAPYGVSLTRITPLGSHRKQISTILQNLHREARLRINKQLYNCLGYLDVGLV